MESIFDAAACALQTCMRSDAPSGEFMDSRGSPVRWELSTSVLGGFCLAVHTVDGTIAVAISIPFWWKTQPT
jgi:hypothetical protein